MPMLFGVRLFETGADDDPTFRNDQERCPARPPPRPGSGGEASGLWSLGLYNDYFGMCLLLWSFGISF